MVRSVSFTLYCLLDPADLQLTLSSTSSLLVSWPFEYLKPKTVKVSKKQVLYILFSLFYFLGRCYYLFKHTFSITTKDIVASYQSYVFSVTSFIYISK